MIDKQKCRCGREIVYALNSPTPYCPGCIGFGTASGCDCTPAQSPDGVSTKQLHQGTHFGRNPRRTGS